MKSKLKISSALLSAIALFSGATAFGAERVTVSFGSYIRSIDAQELRVLAGSNRATGMIADILRLAKVSPEQAGSALRAPFMIDAKVVGDVLYTPLGEKVLAQLGAIIHPLRSSSKAAIPALRSAVMMSLLDDNYVSPIELISNYPVQMVIDLESVLSLSKRAKNLDDLAKIIHDLPGGI